MKGAQGNSGGQEREKKQITRRIGQDPEKKSQKRRAGERKSIFCPPEQNLLRQNNYPARYSVPCWRPGCRGRAPQKTAVGQPVAEWSYCVRWICDNGESVRSVQFPVIGTMYIRRRAKMSREPWNTATSRSKVFPLTKHYSVM